MAGHGSWKGLKVRLLVLLVLVLLEGIEGIGVEIEGIDSLKL